MLVIYRMAQGGRRQKISQVGAKLSVALRKEEGRIRYTLGVNGHKESRGGGVSG